MYSLVGCAVLALPACKSRQGQPIIDVRITDHAGIGVGGDLRLDPGTLETAALRGLAASGFQRRAAAEGEVGFRLVASVQLTTERDARPDDAGVLPKDQVFRAVGVSLSLEGDRPDPIKKIRERYESDAIVGKNLPMLERFDTLVEEAFRRAAEFIALDRELLAASESVVIEKLRSPDANVRARAAVVVGERQIRAALPALLEILRDPNELPAIVSKTIGALVVLKDPRAVGPLIDSARQRPAEYLGQVIFGVAAIGGREAEAYLYTVASGHPDPETKKNASDALEELQRRRERGEARANP